MKKLEKYKYYILSFLVPIMLVLVFFVVLKIRYNDTKLFSSYEILMGDMKTQYISLMQYFSNVLHGKDSLIYSFSNSLGGNMVATYAYYLSSPLNLILVFASHHNITNFAMFLIIIKFGLCGLSMYIYLNNKIKNNSNNALIISIFYALMSYNITYYFNTMWIDVVYFLPLVLYGIDDIINKNKISKYVIFLSLSIFSNFYISYMVCIFCVIYFIYELIVNFNKNNKKEIIKCIKIFIISSIISGMISSILLIPTIMDMKNMLRSSLTDSMYIKKNIYLNFLLFLSKLYALPNSRLNVLSQFTPNVYFGILPFLFIISYFYSKDKIKNKIVALIIIFLFVLSFSTNFFNLLWHGFSYPNGYAYRFSFLFIFFMLLLAYKGMCLKGDLKVNKFLILICLILFVGFTELNDGGNISFSFINILITFIFLIVYYILIKLNYYHKKYFKVIMYIFILIELELLLNNSFIVSRDLNYMSDYNHYYDVICSKSEKYKDINYKIDNKLVFSVLDSFSCNDYRLSNGLTTNNGNLYKFLHNSGFVTTYSMVANNNNTPVTYSLLGIKYYYDYEKDNAIEKLKFYYDSYKNKKKFDYIYVHKNDYVLPYGYIIDDNYDKVFEESDKDNPFEFQNALLKSMSGILEDSLKPYKLKKINKKTYELSIDNDKDIYVYLKHDISENDRFYAEITLNDDDIYDIDLGMSGIFKIDNEYAGEVVKVEISSVDDYYYENDDVLSFYYLDGEVFEKQIEKIKETSFVVDEKRNNKLKGKINLDNDGTLFLSIPYEDGFDVYVDGKKVDYLKLYDSFLGIKLKKGNHKISITFIPPGLKLGIFITLTGIIVFIIYNKKNRV